MIRLGVRVRRADAELALAELLAFAPAGVEECDVDAASVEYAVYGAPGELPDIGEMRAALGGALVDVSSRELPDDWAQRWRSFHHPVTVYARGARAAGGAGASGVPGETGETGAHALAIHVRPPWEPPPAPAGGGAIPPHDIVIDPGQAFGTGAHATTRLCLELMLELAAQGRAQGAFVDVGCGSGVLAIAAARLGFAPVLALDHEPESVAAAEENARVNGVGVDVRLADLRCGIGDVAQATVVANLLRGLLLELAHGLTRPPTLLIAGGMLTGELDEVARAFAGTGLHECGRRGEGEWGALSLARAVHM